MFLTYLFTAMSAIANDAGMACRNLDFSKIQPNVDSFLISNPHLNKNNSPKVAFASTYRSNLCYLVLTAQPNDLGDVVEVLVIDPISKKIKEVSAVKKVPKALRVGLGHKYYNGKLGKNLYYTELKNESAYEAFKSIVSGVPVSGLVTHALLATKNTNAARFNLGPRWS